LGNVDAEIVEIVNNIRDRKKALASTQGCKRSLPRDERVDGQTVKGVQHKVSEAKTLRDNAKRMERDLTWRSTPAQRRQVDLAWDRAEAASKEAGHGFKDRHGKFVQPVQDTLVTAALKEYLARRGVPYT